MVVKKWMVIIGVLALTAIAASLYAGNGGINPSLDEHADFLQTAIAFLILLLMAGMTRMMAKVDKKIDLLFADQKATQKQVDTLQGEHNIMKGHCTPPTEKEDLRTELRRALAELNVEIRDDRREATGR